MNRVPALYRLHGERVPRTRGDEPQELNPIAPLVLRSPHTRG